MADHTCAARGECIACAAAELQADYCRESGFKQAAECSWNPGVPKERQDAHALPQFVACTRIADMERRAFFRNHFVFVALGLVAFGLYVWRRRRIYAGAAV
ncbi:hypothetical protein H4R21_000120 [Coemansia helicoidea]|uniref:Uncharacterized protein n=1 Tax=Coemansia helicoidea TaxID=1286919 RepID=A0ACC1LGG7_9FUNG|nr:hypothetical protein H4R21_000120 [Coemansia helicoidea]